MTANNTHNSNMQIIFIDRDVDLPVTITTKRSFNISKINSIYIEYNGSDIVHLTLFISYDNKFWTHFYDAIITTSGIHLLNINKQIFNIISVYDNNNSVYIKMKLEPTTQTNQNRIKRVVLDVDVDNKNNSDNKDDQTIINNDCCIVEESTDKLIRQANESGVFDYSKFHDYILKVHNVMANSYSIDAIYFRTEPVEMDYIIKQYVVKNVAEVKCIRIITYKAGIPDIDVELEDDRVLYTEVQNNQYFYVTHDQFVKDFGNKKPSERDYIFLPVTNRLYEIIRVKPKYGPMMIPIYWVLSVQKFDPNIDLLNSDEYLSKIGKFIKSIDQLFIPKVSEDSRKVIKPEVTQNSNDERYINNDNDTGFIHRQQNIDQFLGYVITDKITSGIKNRNIVIVNGITINNGGFTGKVHYKVKYNKIDE